MFDAFLKQAFVDDKEEATPTLSPTFVAASTRPGPVTEFELSRSPSASPIDSCGSRRKELNSNYLIPRRTDSINDPNRIINKFTNNSPEKFHSPVENYSGPAIYRSRFGLTQIIDGEEDFIGRSNGTEVFSNSLIKSHDHNFSPKSTTNFVINPVTPSYPHTNLNTISMPQQQQQQQQYQYRLKPNLNYFNRIADSDSSIIKLKEDDEFVINNLERMAEDLEKESLGFVQKKDKDPTTSSSSSDLRLVEERSLKVQLVEAIGGEVSQQAAMLQHRIPELERLLSDRLRRFEVRLDEVRESSERNFQHLLLNNNAELTLLKRNQASLTNEVRAQRDEISALRARLDDKTALLLKEEARVKILELRSKDLELREEEDRGLVHKVEEEFLKNVNVLQAEQAQAERDLQDVTTGLGMTQDAIAAESEVRDRKEREIERGLKDVTTGLGMTQEAIAAESEVRDRKEREIERGLKDVTTGLGMTQDAIAAESEVRDRKSREIERGLKDVTTGLGMTQEAMLARIDSSIQQSKSPLSKLLVRPMSHSSPPSAAPSPIERLTTDRRPTPKDTSDLSYSVASNTMLFFGDDPMEPGDDVDKVDTRFRKIIPKLNMNSVVNHNSISSSLSPLHRSSSQDTATLNINRAKVNRSPSPVFKNNSEEAKRVRRLLSPQFLRPIAERRAALNLRPLSCSSSLSPSRTNINYRAARNSPITASPRMLNSPSNSKILSGSQQTPLNNWSKETTSVVVMKNNNNASISKSSHHKSLDFGIQALLAKNPIAVPTVSRSPSPEVIRDKLSQPPPQVLRELSGHARTSLLTGNLAKPFAIHTTTTNLRRSMSANLNSLSPSDGGGHLINNVGNTNLKKQNLGSNLLKTQPGNNLFPLRDVLQTLSIVGGRAVETLKNSNPHANATFSETLSSHQRLVSDVNANAHVGNPLLCKDRNHLLAKVKGRDTTHSAILEARRSRSPGWNQETFAQFLSPNPNSPSLINRRNDLREPKNLKIFLENPARDLKGSDMQSRVHRYGNSVIAQIARRMRGTFENAMLSKRMNLLDRELAAEKQRFLEEEEEENRRMINIMNLSKNSNTSTTNKFNKQSSPETGINSKSNKSKQSEVEVNNIVEGLNLNATDDRSSSKKSPYGKSYINDKLQHLLNHNFLKKNQIPSKESKDEGQKQQQQQQFITSSPKLIQCQQKTWVQIMEQEKLRRIWQKQQNELRLQNAVANAMSQAKTALVRRSRSPRYPASDGESDDPTIALREFMMENKLRESDVYPPSTSSTTSFTLDSKKMMRKSGLKIRKSAHDADQVSNPKVESGQTLKSTLPTSGLLGSLDEKTMKSVTQQLVTVPSSNLINTNINIMQPSKRIISSTTTTTTVKKSLSPRSLSRGFSRPLNLGTEQPSFRASMAEKSNNGYRSEESTRGDSSCSASDNFQTVQTENAPCNQQ